MTKNVVLSVLTATVLLYLVKRLTARRGRRALVPVVGERVVIVGASSGVGKNIALEYAKRGAQLILVARRENELRQVVQDCQSSTNSTASLKILEFVGDFTKISDLVHLREFVESEWGGLDTLHIIAGVSALKPVLDIRSTTDPTSLSANLEELERVSLAAITSNFHGPLLTAYAFVPLLKRTSKSPAIHHLSSVAALIPAPTRALYGSTKSASYVGLRSLAIEHPEIKWTFVLPATIEGDFRKSAVDKGDIVESLHGVLSSEYVAKMCVKAVDNSTKVVVIPKFYWFASLIQYIIPTVVERGARKKYAYTGSTTE